MSWEKVKLGDICESISDGDHLPPPKSVDGIPFVTISNVNSSNQFDFKNTMFVPQEYYEKLDEKRKPRINDILYSVVGSFGIPVFIKENRPFVFQRHIAILRPDESRIYPRYLYYKMLSKDFYMKADAVAIGAAQRTISLTSLRNMEISIPCKDSQKRIADILSAYDDLIENNQKQIKLLEEAAQRLYKQWFIDLRFPGHETTPIVNGLPKGWRKDRADSFFNITIGKTPPRAEKQWFTEDGNGLPWISISDMGTDSAFLFETSEGLTLEAVKRHNVKVVPANTVLLSFKLTVGRVSITTTEMCTNEAIAHFVTDDDSLREYTYCYLKNFHYDELGSTSSISKAINSKIVKAMPFVIPVSELLEKFYLLVKPIFDEIFTKQKQILSLKQSRERILPKLMSGEICP